MDKIIRTLRRWPRIAMIAASITIFAITYLISRNITASAMTSLIIGYLGTEFFLLRN